MSDCPTTERLQSLLDGQLAEAEQAELQQHIDSCEACQQTLEGLVAGKESWDGIARQLGDGDTPVTPALHEAINAAKEMEATIPSVKLPAGLLQPAQQSDSMGRLAHYEILQEVGSGGMGIVLKAFDTSLRRVVAVKVMAPHLAANAAARRRFVREAQAAAAVAHEHVVAIHAVADQHEPPYLAMQFIEGKTLQERLDKSGPLSVREVLRIGMQTAAGLAAAHTQGLVHRDIKPANILLENGVERVKLTDFGLARAVDDASVTQSGVIAGTPLFMSPEQARGEAVDHRSDLFSLGSVMYAMCVGHAPFRASTTMGVIKRVCDESPRPIRELNPEVPEWLANIVNKLLAKNAAERFASAKEVSELLGQCLAHWQQPAMTRLPTTIPGATHSSATAAPDPIESEHSDQDPESSSRIGRLVTGFLVIAFLAVVGLFGAEVLGFVSEGTRSLTMSYLIATMMGILILGRLLQMAFDWLRPPSGVAIDSARSTPPMKPESMSPKEQAESWLSRIPWAAWFGLALFVSVYVVALLDLQGDIPSSTAKTLGLVMLAASMIYVAAWGVIALLIRAIRGTHPGPKLEPRPWRIVMFFSLLTIFTIPWVSKWVRNPEAHNQATSPAKLIFRLAGPHVEVTLNGEKVAVPPSGQELVLSLVAGEYVITTIRNGRPEVRSGETLHAGERKMMNEPQADGIQISGPLVLAYGPGASAPNVADYVAIQGRWAIVSQERNGEVVTAAQRSQWLEFDRGYLRTDVPDTPRAGAFVTESLVALYANETPARIDILNNGAKGIYKLEGDTLMLAIADARSPIPTEFVSRPGSGITLTVCRRASASSSPLDLNGVWDTSHPWPVEFTHWPIKANTKTVPIKGKYAQTGPNKWAGRIDATLDVATRTIEGEFFSGSSGGHVRLVVSDDGDDISGTYAWKPTGDEPATEYRWDMRRRPKNSDAGQPGSLTLPATPDGKPFDWKTPIALLGTPLAAPIDLNGDWNSRFHTVTFTHELPKLSETSLPVKATYYSGDGIIEGTLNLATRTFEGRFRESRNGGRNGPIRLVVAPDGRTLFGQYAYRQPGMEADPTDLTLDWNMTRHVQTPLELNGDWDSRWQTVTFAHELPKPGDKSIEVKATYYDGGGVIEGTLNLAPRTFEGRFRERNSMNGPIRLVVLPDGQSISGRYAYRQPGMTEDPTDLNYDWNMTRRGASPIASSPPSSPVDSSPVELDRLVDLAEQDWRRVRELVAKNIAPVVQAEEAEERLIDARVSRAIARKDHAEVVSQLRRLVEIRELDRSRLSELVRTKTVPPSELAKAEKRWLEARLRLKEAEAALELTLVSAPGIAWGETSPKGIQLGIQFAPRREEYRVGDVIKLRILLRNTGKTAMSTTQPRLEVLEKFGLDLMWLTDGGEKLPWQWGPAHKSREQFTVSGGIEFSLPPGATRELPSAEIVIGSIAVTPNTLAQLDAKPEQDCRLSAKLGTYGYAKDEGEPLESSELRFRIAK